MRNNSNIDTVLHFEQMMVDTRVPPKTSSTNVFALLKQSIKKGKSNMKQADLAELSHRKH